MTVLFVCVVVVLMQIVSDVMISDVRSPTLHMYTENKEDSTTKQAAFELMMQSRHVSHEAVCNAVLGLDSGLDSLVAAATAYLSMVALICGEQNKRQPALSALTGSIVIIMFILIHFIFEQIILILFFDLALISL